MPIQWDTLLARHTARELDRSLAGARLRAVRLDRAERDMTLLFEERTLIWRLHPTRGYLRLHPPVEPTDGDHRYRCTLRAIEAPPDERIVRFRFSGGRPGPLSVVVELMSTQWNALVTEGESDTLRHLLWRPRNEARRIMGQRYREPPSTGRIGATADLSPKDWLDVLEAVPEHERVRTLVRRIAWTSPLNAPTFIGRGAGGGDVSALEIGFERWKKMADPAARSEPVVLERGEGLQPYPFPLADLPSRGADTLLAAFEECAHTESERSEASPATVLGPELLAVLERRVLQVTRRVASLESELAGLPDPVALRAIGDLILARYQEVPPGAVSATLSGFDGEPVTVELDPSEPSHANASRYYERAAKAERAAKRLPGLLEEARADFARFEGLLERVRAGAADEAEVREALGPMTAAPRGEALFPSLPYRTFRSSGGLEIRVGKGARFNDDLTFRHSSPGDVWLHARHTAGAHVVLRWHGSGRPPARDLEEAAVLAAVHSKARTSGSVPVDWTLRKYVRKPRKSPPGQVAADRVQTLFVEPDESLVDRLADRRKPE